MVFLVLARSPGLATVGLRGIVGTCLFVGEGPHGDACGGAPGRSARLRGPGPRPDLKSSVTGYYVRRLVQAIVVMFIVSLIVFVLLHMLPGGLVRAQLGPKATFYAVHELTLQEGLNKPLPVQFWLWLWHALHGNLGFSYKQNQSVASLLAEFVPRTLLLVGSSMLLALAVAVPMGLIQGLRRDHLDDHALTAIMLVFYTTPSFLMGSMLIVALSIWLDVLPSTASNFGTGTGTDFRGTCLARADLVSG